MNCTDTRNTCGNSIPSACVPFTGEKPSFITEENFPCDVNLDDVIAQFASNIQTVLDSINLKLLNKRCLDFDPTEVTVKELHQVEIDALCAVKAQLESLQTSFDSLNVATKLITLDLQCLTPVNNPCSLNTNSYTLYYILNKLVTEVCNLKQSICT